MGRSPLLTSLSSFAQPNGYHPPPSPSLPQSLPIINALFRGLGAPGSRGGEGGGEGCGQLPLGAAAATATATASLPQAGTVQAPVTLALCWWPQREERTLHWTKVAGRQVCC